MNRNTVRARTIFLSFCLVISLQACVASAPSSYGYQDRSSGYDYSDAPYYGGPAYVGPSVNLNFDGGWHGGRR